MEACTFTHARVTSQRREGSVYVAALGRAVVKGLNILCTLLAIPLVLREAFCSSTYSNQLSESNGFLFFLYLVKCSGLSLSGKQFLLYRMNRRLWMLSLKQRGSADRKISGQGIIALELCQRDNNSCLEAGLSAMLCFSIVTLD